MAHYAFIDENNMVTEVIVGIDETELIEGLPPEQWYFEFREMKCVRTSYNSTIRGKYAGIGDLYDENLDVFVSLRWMFVDGVWQAPVENLLEES